MTSVMVNNEDSVKPVSIQVLTISQIQMSNPQIDPSQPAQFQLCSDDTEIYRYQIQEKSRNEEFHFGGSLNLTLHKLTRNQIDIVRFSPRKVRLNETLEKSKNSDIV